MGSLVTSHITSLYVMPEVSQLTTCGERLNRASSVFLSRKHSGPVKPGNDKNVALLMNSLVTVHYSLVIIKFRHFHIP